MYVALTTMARQNWADALSTLGVRAVSLSFAHMRKKGARKILETYKEVGAWVMIDSGAHTLSGESAGELESYLGRYISFVEANQDVLDCWVEFDAISHVPLETVAVWRERWKTAALADRLVVVYHGDAAVIDGTFKHVGLSSGEPDSHYSRFFRDHLSDLRDHGVRVYGRGITRAAVLQLPWFAVDSSTWTAWGRWGHIYFWNRVASRLEVFQQPDISDLQARNELRVREMDRRVVWEEAAEHGLSDDLRRLDGWAVDRWNALQWIHLQRHLESQVGNAYWLTEREKHELVAQRRETGGVAMVVGGAPSTYVGELSIGAKMSPALQVGRYCDHCVVSDRCPVYRPMGECALSQLQPIETKDDVVSAVQGLLALQYDRVQVSALMERLQGGGLTKDVTKNMEMFMDMLLKLKQLSSSSSEEVTVKVAGQGIISRLFGGVIEDARRGVVQRAIPQVEAVDVVTVNGDGEVEDG